MLHAIPPLAAPMPPDPRHAGHHWLEVKDRDGHSFGLVVLFWQPASRAWCHSGQFASGLDVDCTGYRYVGPVPYPEGN